ncbi:hypothetical protein ACIQ9J_01695 [Streptomyces sp. NPDC094153]|uniref:hypothetical protein n=1 Tax=Streptomyces sp. NPDC094153 TaxID=3366058 RepID=UPI003826892A
MPWVKLDDRFPSHRKVALLSDRAFRLHVSALCWASENLTEGRILDRELSLVSRIRGAKAAAKELEEARLWDRIDGGWSIHDYLEYNPDRARVRADREANAARQKAFRERKRAEREAARNAERNAPRNGVTPDGIGPESESSEGKTLHDGDTNAQRTDPTNQQSPQVNEICNGVSNGTPSPSPSRPVLPTEVPPPPSPSEKPSGRNEIEVSGRGEIQPLIDAMHARGMTVSWTFSAAEWIDLRDAVRRAGVPTLVDHAARAWQAAKSQPYSAKYFLRGWTGLQEPTAYTGPRPVAGPPSKTTEYLEDMAAIAEELRQKKTGGA